MIDVALYNKESDESNDPSESLKLISELTFTNWNEFKNWIDRFVFKKGFSYRIRISEKFEGIVWRATYKYTKSDLCISQVILDLTKHHNAYFQWTQYPWKLNVTHPKTSDIIRINSFKNTYNHSLIYTDDLWNSITFS